MYKTDGNDAAANQVRALKKQEHRREAQREVKSALRPNNNAQILHVEVEDKKEDNGVRFIYEKEEMEQEVMRDHVGKYTECCDTPSLLEPLQSILGPFGLTMACKLILQGSYRLPPVVHPDIVDFFNHLVINEEINREPPTSAYNSVEDYKAYWKLFREKVASSISKMHNGHYMAATKNEHICKTTALMSTLPWILGISLERWRNSLNIELEKRFGERLVHKLRTIHLLEADFNMGTKSLLGKRVINNTIKHGKIPPEQYAAKGRKGIDAVLVKRLFYDLLRIAHIAGALIANDARGCFDRMTLLISSLCLRRMGAPISVLQTLYETIATMKHYVRTGHGESQSYYTNPVGKYLQGGGQGNGSGPPTWICISIVLISIINAFPVNAAFTSAITGLTITLCAIMYVDDTDLLIAGNYHNDFIDVSAKAQALAHKWCSALRITGGALRPEKCWWYLISFCWLPDGSCRYATTEETPGTIQIPDYKMNPSEIKRHEVSTGKMGLGVLLAPDGSNGDQIEYMQDKVSTWTKRIKASFLSTFAAIIALKTTIWATLSYPLAALTLTKKSVNDS